MLRFENINYSEHLWEGWTVSAVVNDLSWAFDNIMLGRSWRKPFKTEAEVKAWVKAEKPNIKKLSGVNKHFIAYWKQLKTEI